MLIRDLEFICRLAEFGSVTRAARDLGVDASTLSRRVSALEDELGILLFERGRAGTTSTYAGRNVLQIAQRMIADAGAMRDVAARSSLALVGELRLATAASSLGPRLRPAVSAWKLAHPKVDLALSEMTDNEAFASLRARRVDVAIVHTPGPADINTHLLLEEHIFVAAAEDHPLARRQALRWQDVRTEPLLIRGSPAGESARSIVLNLLGSGVDLRIQKSGSIDLLNLVAIGEGVALLCESHAEIGFPGIEYVKVAEDNAKVFLELAWLPALDDPVAGSFVAFMRDWKRHHQFDQHAEASRTRDRS
jgi:DNA-binding transcriptional LysR family regulator